MCAHYLELRAICSHMVVLIVLQSKVPCCVINYQLLTCTSETYEISHVHFTSGPCLARQIFAFDSYSKWHPFT